MKQLIANLLRKPEPVKRYCTVVKPLSGDRYQVRDVAGRLFAVDSTVFWGVGDGVTVQQGRIVGKAVRFVNFKTYGV